MKTIATYYETAWTGIDIKGFEYGVDDKVIYEYINANGKADKHKTKVYTDTERAYFICNGKRIHLDECLRTNY